MRTVLAAPVPAIAPDLLAGLRTRSAAIAGGTFLALTVAMHTIPRGDWVYLCLLAGILFALLLASGWRLSQAARPLPAAIALAGFGLLAMATELWGAEPGMAVRAGAAFLAIALLGTLAADCVARLPDQPMRSAALGLLIGCALGLAFIIVECLTHFAIHRAILNTIPGLIRETDAHLRIKDGWVVGIKDAVIKRHMTQATLLLWPLVLIAASLWRGAKGQWIAALALAATVTAAALARHDSSTLAIAASLTVFIAAGLSFRTTWRLVAAVWFLLAVAVVPLMAWQFEAKAYANQGLPDSFRHRLVIWGYTAAQTMQAPLKGIGAGSGKAVDARRTDVVTVPGENFAFRTADHQHDVYLQTWYEMGALGAFALYAAGFLALWRIRRLPADVRGHALATFVAAMFLVSTSYGLWQEWFIASIALSAVAVTLAIRVSRPDAFEWP